LNETSDLLAVVTALVLYLRVHPQASDTAEGIRRWWLPGEVSMDLARLVQALECMERSGLVERTTAGDGRVRWRRRGDAASFECNWEALADALRAIRKK
jgi:hypothetical protein